ncbi:MAG: pyridoxamine 5'-phosphate oxidase family protein [Alphaproteobacteria bacterium]|nr:pyridoxamine 5'-phosphate oxidase family protein [Alphaproteobacteria bacterium]
MAKQFNRIAEAHQRFIEAQKTFFVGSAASSGRVNISPKGMDSLRILGPNRIVWLNLTGSGNETAGHLLDVNRMTLMWCAFEGLPMIMRAYGSARTVHPRDPDWGELATNFAQTKGSWRQIFDMKVETVQTSCGFGVPLFDYVAERDGLVRWAEKKGLEGEKTYWKERNGLTIDGNRTGILGDGDK